MPNKNTQNKNDDKNYHAQRKRLEKERLKLENRLNELYQQEKSIPSASAKKDIHEKIKILEREIVENEMALRHMDERNEKEKYRRKHCKIKSCPISPLQELCHALQKNTLR